MSWVKEGASMTFQVPVLTPTNYPVWGIKVKLIWMHATYGRRLNRGDGRISQNMIDQQRYSYQDKKGMDKQHGSSIMAMKVWRTLDVTEVEVGCPGKVVNRNGCCLGKTGEATGRSTVNKGCECGGVSWWLMVDKHSFHTLGTKVISGGIPTFPMFACLFL
ncbi:unnamed protein product [Lactuca saligna]|uniref:Uncharacterized protein n=1 Tax=Lactuca saligna TaxID=75948 RepID=A0AA35V7J4_LACSI|nr:unnamed protein product [Lactuca saligna]